MLGARFSKRRLVLSAIRRALADTDGRRSRNSTGGWKPGSASAPILVAGPGGLFTDISPRRRAAEGVVTVRWSSNRPMRCKQIVLITRQGRLE